MRYQQLAQARQAGRPGRGRPARPGATPTWAGPSSTGSSDAAGGVRWRRACPATSPRSASGGGGGAIFLRAMLERPRGARPAGLGRRHVLGHVAGPTPVTMPRAPSCRRQSAGWPATSTRCATASPGSACSTTACGSSRARPAETLADAPDRPLALLRIGEGPASTPSACSSVLHPRLSPGAEVIVSGVADPEVEAAVEPGPRPPRHHGADRAGRLERGHVAARGAGRGAADAGARAPRRRAGRRPRASEARRPSPLAPPAPTAERGPVGRRRLLQHAARGGPHAPLAVPLLPARHRGPRLRGDRRRQRLRRPTSASARSTSRRSGPSSGCSTWAATPTPSPTGRAQRRHRRRPRARRSR